MDRPRKQLKVDVTFHTTAIFSPESSCSMVPSPIPRTSTRPIGTTAETATTETTTTTTTSSSSSTTTTSTVSPIPAACSCRWSDPKELLETSPKDWFSFEEEEEVLAKRRSSSGASREEAHVETMDAVNETSTWWDTRQLFVVDGETNTTAASNDPDACDTTTDGFGSEPPNQSRKRCRHHRSVVEIDFADVLPQLEDFPVEDIPWKIY